jgi:hypothetical protein
MFGYIRAAKPELKVWEYEMYKAVYCTLCRNLGKSYGLLSRFTLSYDFTFLALLKMALSEGCTEIKKGRCAFNPLKKCNYCKESDAFELPSAAAMIMLYYKLKDNIADEKGFRKLGFMCVLPLFSGAYKKAANKYPQIEKYVSQYIENQSILEKNGCAELDRIADPTAGVLSEILMLCSEDESQKRVLKRLGYCLGRYIYILDAACDFEADNKTGAYNVLKYENKEVFSQELKEKIKAQLYFCVNEAGKAFELLDIKKYRNILGNIIYLGLEDTFKKELEI